MSTCLRRQAPEKAEPFTLIIGTSKLGLTVAQQLRAHGDQIRFMLCGDEERHMLDEEGLPYLPEGIDQLYALDPAELRTVLILHDDDLGNLELSKRARQIGVEAAIARVKDPQHLPKFDAEGVKTFSPALERVTMVSMMARNPNILTLMTTTSDERASVEIRVRRLEVAGKQLRDQDLPGDLLVLAVRRGGQLLIPRGSFSIELDDQVSLLGGYEELGAARRLFEG